MRFTFQKHEKLKSRKTIGALFSEGKGINKFPLRMIYLHIEGQESIKAGFSVPKRNFKLAVSRNRIKRLMREAYRLHKNKLKPNNGDNFALLFLYIGRKECDFSEIEKAMTVLLDKLPE
ncbi:ribonuclease P protein component [Aureitalea sp. L0-47]|uniref:ribonuclease P protein component n=1 Tax=Aureitalea sp. L0-47 TaxID=2816962 RepID=UPI002238E06A|nr:ribonuclease P protein component [Aureitalea sp. L0-47]MCW5519912.1 ribonuclease P protein component [Aureitalea sp. L0-47]